MLKEPTQRLANLRHDYETVAGAPFRHFFCPILYRDEDVELCDAHIVNAAFTDSPKATTIQRKDVDAWFGSMFEADWVVIQERGKHRLPDVLADKKLTRKLRPQFWRDGQRVEHYVASSRDVSPGHAPIQIGGGEKPLQFVLKLDRSDVLSKEGSHWEVSIQRDLRLPALVSLLKAAHLTLFHMLGYRYVYSPGGRFLGYDTLGRFYLENRGRPKREVLARAREHFNDHIGIVRPMVSAPRIEGTVSDRILALCMPRPGDIWGMLVFIKAAGAFHAVLVPTFSNPDAVDRYIRFLRQPFPRFEACFGKFEGSQWIYTKTEGVVEWPPPAFD